MATENLLPDVSDIIGVGEAGEILHLSTSTLYKKTMRNSEDPLPHFKRGKKLLFLRSELVTWLLKGRRVAGE